MIDEAQRVLTVQFDSSMYSFQVIQEGSNYMASCRELQGLNVQATSLQLLNECIPLALKSWLKEK